jgi:tRNA(Glu) U13 pseudouridine synthase TruD
VRLAFALPPGCYATSVLRELIRAQPVPHDASPEPAAADEVLL